MLAYKPPQVTLPFQPQTKGGGLLLQQGLSNHV